MNREAPRCPVCRAPFRGTTTCSRCSADLTRIMLLTARAHRLREQACQAFIRADYGLAALRASAATATQDHPASRALERIATLLILASRTPPRGRADASVCPHPTLRSSYCGVPPTP